MARKGLSELLVNQAVEKHAKEHGLTKVESAILFNDVLNRGALNTKGKYTLEAERDAFISVESLIESGLFK